MPEVWRSFIDWCKKYENGIRFWFFIVLFVSIFYSISITFTRENRGLQSKIRELETKRNDISKQYESEQTKAREVIGKLTVELRRSNDELNRIKQINRELQDTTDRLREANTRATEQQGQIGVGLSDIRGQVRELGEAEKRLRELIESN